MPKLYEYRGVSVIFHSNEHEPVHVHGLHEDRATKAEIIRVEGAIVNIQFTSVTGRRILEGSPLDDFTQLVKARAGEIVEKWEAYFVRHERITPEIITRRIR